MRTKKNKRISRKKNSNRFGSKKVPFKCAGCKISGTEMPLYYCFSCYLSNRRKNVQLCKDCINKKGSEPYGRLNSGVGPYICKIHNELLERTDDDY